MEIETFIFLVIVNTILTWGTIIRVLMKEIDKNKQDQEETNRRQRESMYNVQDILRTIVYRIDDLTEKINQNKPIK